MLAAVATRRCASGGLFLATCRWRGDAGPRRRRWATYKRPHGERHLLAAYDLSTNRICDRSILLGDAS
ncbi:hypothetical protein GCM10010404_04030 [Nonomuraea africana]